MINEIENDTEQIEQPIKKKLGRPRKEQEKEIIEKVKNPVGRPKKERLPEDELKPKKPVGRPKQNMKPPKEPKTHKIWADDPIKYYRNYYQEKIKVRTECDVCKKEFTNLCSYRYHKKHCKTCQVKKILLEAGVIEPFVTSYNGELDFATLLNNTIISL